MKRRFRGVSGSASTDACDMDPRLDREYGPGPVPAVAEVVPGRCIARGAEERTFRRCRRRDSNPQVLPPGFESLSTPPYGVYSTVLSGTTRDNLRDLPPGRFPLNPAQHVTVTAQSRQQTGEPEMCVASAPRTDASMRAPSRARPRPARPKLSIGRPVAASSAISRQRVWGRPGARARRSTPPPVSQLPASASRVSMDSAARFSGSSGENVPMWSRERAGINACSPALRGIGRPTARTRGRWDAGRPGRVTAPCPRRSSG